MTGNPQRIQRTSRGLATALLLAAIAAIGCDDVTVEEIIEEQMTQLERRQLSLDQVAAGMYDFASPPPTTDEDCTVTLQPGSDPDGDPTMINTAIEDASTWDVICLAAGSYKMGDAAGNDQGRVSVSSAANLTVKGIGATPADTVLDYAESTQEKGFFVTTPGFWIENLTIKNTTGNGVEIKATNTAENPNVFRKLHVYWDAGSVTENGAYSVYPTSSEYVIVEFNEVEGASDAGLYVGQVEHGIVRYNNVHANVAGLEVENSFDVAVYENEVWDNTGGILALQEPGLNRLKNEYVAIHDNDVHDNNRANFAPAGATVANIPAGTGLMSFAGMDIEFRDNLVENNDTVGLLIVSNVILDQIGGGSAPYSYSPAGYDPYPTWVNQTGNTYTNNGTDPDALLRLAAGNPPLPLDPIMWDGFISDGVEVPALADVADPNICFGSTDTPAYTIIRNDAKHAVNDYECDMRPVIPTAFP